MNRNVIIIGNSGAARECYWLLQDVMQRQPELQFKGFLAFEGHASNLKDLSSLELGSDETYTAGQNDTFIIGIGPPYLRLKAYHKWKERGAHFMTLMHPNVLTVGEVKLGEGNILACGSYVSCNAVLGNANYLNGSVTVGHDVCIGDGNFFGPFSLVLGGASIGSGNSFGVRAVTLPGARIGDNNIIAPGAYIYTGCGNNRLMAGNPALEIEAMNS